MSIRCKKIVIFSIIGLFYGIIGAKLIHNNLSSTQEKRYNERYEHREIVYLNREYECIESKQEQYENNSETGERYKSKFRCKDDDSYIYHNITINGAYSVGDKLNIKTATITITEKTNERNYKKNSWEYINSEMLSADEFQNKVKEDFSKSIKSNIEGDRKEYNIVMICILAIVSILWIFPLEK